MPGVFISYRRGDTAGYAGRLYDALAAHLGKKLVFIDIDSIRAGQDFANAIEQWIASCSVVIVLIGKGWLNSTDERGARRLDNPNDFVRFEISSALRQNVPVIPVLVGGGTMPHPDDLPSPLTPLAHLNAIEIFDQLFPDSVRHLVSVLRPLVHPLPRYWRWTGPGANRLRVLVLTLTLLVALGIAGIVLTAKHSPDEQGTHKSALLSSETLTGPEESGLSSTPVRIRTPSDIEELPPIIEASRNVMMPGSSSQVTGPDNPRILWSAKVTVGDAWHVDGIAADGTVYVYDEEDHVLDAIGDGKEQWAFDFVGADVPITPDFAPDGRVWLGDYCFNSRGEGGRVTRKKLLPDRTTLMPLRQERPYHCSGGKVSPLGSRQKQTWAFDLDGNCGSQQPTDLPSTGNIYAFSDLGTLYAITRDGRLEWTVKQACKSRDVHGYPLRNFSAYPLPDDELIVACEGQPLYAFREGRPLWTSAIIASGLSEPIFDGSGNIYVGNVALNKSGKQIWKLSAGFSPVGFDSQGRLYGLGQGGIVSLSR